MRTSVEIMDKRSCIPVQKELNPYIEGRFRELLDANSGNTRARDFLLIYYLMDGDLDAFSELCSQYGLQPGDNSPVFEEGLLLHRIENNLPPDTIPFISEATHERFRKFSRLRSQYAEDKYKARNVLYWEMGTTYFYYYYYLYPRIIKPELSQQDEDEIPI